MQRALRAHSSSWLRASRALAALWLSSPLAAAQAVATDPPGLPAMPADAPLTRRLRVADVEPAFDPDLTPGDGVPLPYPAVVRPGSDGDELVAPPSGEPFFLAFAGGRHEPPAAELVDPLLVARVAAAPQDQRPDDVAYAFAMFSRRITPARIAELESLGVRVLEFQPHYALAIAVPRAALDRVAALPFVRWVGFARKAQKVHPRLAAALARAQDDAPLDVYVSLFESDLCAESDFGFTGTLQEVGPAGPLPAVQDPLRLPQMWQSHGWQQRELEARGVAIQSYVESIRAFQARVAPSRIDSLLDLDFVKFVELDVPAESHHDESTPMIASDMVRWIYDGAASGAVTAGQIDSGIDHDHSMLNHTYGIGFDFGASQTGAWNDQCGHGSHVNGTLLGRDPLQPSLTGNAPGLGFGNDGFFFNVKFLEPNGSKCTGNTAHATLYDALDDDYVNPAGVSPYPMAVNNSWGSSPGATPWIGSEANPRTLDAQVFTKRQLYVFSAGNDGLGGVGDASTIGSPGVAKNAFTVGNVVDYDSPSVGDPGNLWTSSSRGPAGDGRWKPNVAAPGQWIRSAKAGTASATIDKSGTSMAAPHATGVAVQLMDAYSNLRYRPEKLASLLMATAITKDDQTLSAPSTQSTHHLNTYGAGRINAFKALWNTSQFDTDVNGFTQTPSGWHYEDFTVPAGATRLVVCMTYHEAACSAGAAQALVNDLDLWIDRAPIDPAGNTGDYFAQQSSVDNTEIRIIDNPMAGAWRWKVYPDSVVSSCYVGVTVTIVLGDTTPDGSLVLTADSTCVKPNQSVTITATASNPSAVASAVFLDSTSVGDTLLSSSTTLGDLAVTDLMGNQHSGRDVLLGDILHGSSRAATWVTRWSTDGAKSFGVDARSDNWVDKSATILVTVDGTAPPLPQGLISTSHTAGVWSKQRDIAYVWAQSPDAGCGMAGYGIATTPSAPALPSAVPDLVFVTHYEETLPLQSGVYYFNLRPYDVLDNWHASYANFGPIYLDITQPNYLTGLTSSSHALGVLSCNGAVTMTWDPATDTHSGIGGYDVLWDHSPDTLVGGTYVLGANATSHAQALASSTQPWYFHVAPGDGVGNWQNTVTWGPIWIDTASTSAYCVAKVNSQGCTPAIGWSGLPSIGGADDFHVTATNVVNNKNGLIFWGQSPDNAPFQGGTLCVKLPVIRTAVQNSKGSGAGTDCSGAFDYHWTEAYSASQGLGVGSKVYAQYWYRDPQSPSGTGLTDALSFVICDG